MKKQARKPKGGEMKRYAIPIFCFAMLPILSGLGFSQASPRGLSKLTLDGHTISVDYGRPFLKGATIEQAMQRPFEPGDGFWRLGANSSTTFKSSTSLKFGDTTIPAGTYSLYAQRQSDNSWKLVFNKQHGQWGTSHDPSKDFAFIPFHERKTSNSVDELTIRLERRGNGGVFLVHWGDMELTVPFAVA
jgi:hypothetical protein